MWPYVDVDAVLAQQRDRAAARRAEAAEIRRARAARPVARHRSGRWWSRWAGRAGTRAPAHP